MLAMRRDYRDYFLAAGSADRPAPKPEAHFMIRR